MTDLEAKPLSLQPMSSQTSFRSLRGRVVRRRSATKLVALAVCQAAKLVRPTDGLRARIRMSSVSGRRCHRCPTGPKRLNFDGQSAGSVGSPSRTSTELAASSHGPKGKSPDPNAPASPYRVVAGLAKPAIRISLRPCLPGLDRIPARGCFVPCSDQLSKIEEAFVDVVARLGL